MHFECSPILGCASGQHGTQQPTEQRRNCLHCLSLTMASGGLEELFSSAIVLFAKNNGNTFLFSQLSTPLRNMLNIQPSFCLQQLLFVASPSRPCLR